ncbi:hypothetical protein HYU89_00075 [Candidatus Collierbacteria bacterium]|nr:hypothetical protein [Candidatus Collierbacteria bacterium]
MSIASEIENLIGWAGRQDLSLESRLGALVGAFGLKVTTPLVTLEKLVKLSKDGTAPTALQIGREYYQICNPLPPPRVPDGKIFVFDRSGARFGLQAHMGKIALEVEAGALEDKVLAHFNNVLLREIIGK